MLFTHLQSQSSSSVRLLGRFYTDRFFRLTPALILVVGLVYPIHYQRHAGKDMASVNQYALLALSYLSNWPSLRPSSETGPWGNTWSLAVEEQFYIFWAVALPMLLPRGTRLRAFILFASTTSLFVVFRIYSSMYDGVLWGLDWRFGLLANVWKMLVGASLRLLPSPVWLLNRVWAYVGLLGFAITLGLSCLDQPNYGSIAPGWGDSTRPLLAFADLSSVILTSLLLCGVSGPKGGIAILELQPVRFVGRVSYSWYLWQVPLIELNYWRRGYPAIGDTAIAFIMAMISTLYVEEPINKVYKQWKRQNSSSKTIMSLA
jgi:peptidoglycan/LPS O-acetylase OafA/YrhL